MSEGCLREGRAGSAGRMPVLERARRYVAKCAPSISGQGGHNAAYHVAASLVQGFGLNEGDTMTVMREWNHGCQPPWSEAELLHKVRSVANAQHSRARGYLLGEGEAVSRPGQTGAAPAAAPSRKPAFRPMVLKRVASKASGVGDVVVFIKARSAVPVEVQNCASVLRWLYPKGSGEMVLVFSRMQSQGQIIWKADHSDLTPNSDFPSGPDGVWFLPQPVDGQFHGNPRLGGKMSRRSEESVTAWRYVVLESDEAEPEDWLRCLIQMPLRIACICESGGRSVHALVRLDAASKVEWDAQVRRIKPVLITLGADPGALSAVRLTRLPQARRGARVQRLLYLNPAADGTPIFRQAAPRPVYGAGAEGLEVSG